ncbi:putative membrane-bound dehydrogenase-like protein [Pontibacter ummariensis]|uniref:Putative membrane-bound dehydrogenase domain-containing protein n=1 Tax=Pontibacter ummariensis TaxID=1610492 RepID=A0A239ISI3_9BACT|nr:c-type cytochrome [Pontibacter ummariensis]PRY09687.1 putative membrane-bound dehydrogenase-like protein [Pontibacter ummariensis]SNS96003.1 putative membrane-bound dehydrogenase domain-containing protein [Pontibacter ummariensis]
MYPRHTKRNSDFRLSTCSAVVLALLAFVGCNRKNTTEQQALATEDFERVVVDKDPPATPLSPEESMRKIVLPPGYKVELVASEPMVQEPVALAWDGNGRMYVAEMNTYMKDAEGTGQFERTSRIKLLEDTDWDGKMDKATVFVDSLLLPRLVLPVGDQVLVQETNVQHIWSYRDTNGDGKADEKKIVFRNDVLDVRNLEHQNGGLIWNLDNWIYPSRDNLRYKYKDGKLEADTLVDNMIGQWGLTTDNYGQLFYSEAGPGLPAVQIQQMPAYGALNFKDQYTPEFAVPWPIIGTVDAQGGKDVLRPDNTLKHFTSGGGQSIFRGDRMPADMLGDYFIPEPVGRIIKRGEVYKEEGKTYIKDVYEGKDWLASADMNFRPINTYTGPDGTFYIVDMYHGIIQESEWSGPGTYLYDIIQDKELYKNRGMGRIYRVVHKDFKRDPRRPNMLNEPASKLVSYLNHPNGWWRDNAQQLLIVRNDKSVIPALQKIALGQQTSFEKKPGPLARIHALWTLEGMEALDKPTLFKALADDDAQVRKTAVWVAEKFVNQNDQEVIAKLASMQDDPGADVRVQLALSLRGNKTEEAQTAVQELLAGNPNNELMQYSQETFAETQRILAAERERTRNLSPADRELVANGATIYKQLCSNCHGVNGKGRLIGDDEMPAPPLAGSPRVRGDKILLTQLMLNGLQGPVDGKTYPNTMPAMGHQDDKWLASVMSYIRNSSELGNKASVITPEEVKEIRANTPKIPEGMTLQMLEIFKLGRAERTNWAEGEAASQE